MFISNVSIDEVKKSITEISVQPNEVLLLLIGEHTNLDKDALYSLLLELNITFLGAIFPGIIVGNNKTEQGILLKKYEYLTPPQLISSQNEHLTIPEPTNQEKPSTIVFLDGLSSKVADFMTHLQNQLGNRVNYIGGGAGSLSLQQKPCILSKEGWSQDTSIICTIKRPITLAVKHGWEKLYGPLIATKTDKNTIYELNWTNALEVYKKTILNDSQQLINKENFFSIAQAYPFGINRESKEDIVRDPIATGENGELICVGEIPENTVLYILKGSPNNLITSAEQATLMAIKDSKPKDLLIIDCISRTLYLKDQFKKELNAISTVLKEKNIPNIPYGALTLGEISSEGEGLLFFHNKTIVIGSLS